VVIYRNLDDDYGTDYLITHPGRSHAEQIASWDGNFSGTGLTWPELTQIADNPSLADEGVQDTATRLLLLLPHRPGCAGNSIRRLIAALTATGTLQDTAAIAAEHLLVHLARRSHHDPTWTSLLSGRARCRALAEARDEVRVGDDVDRAGARDDYGLIAECVECSTNR
jgi:hypothetical protein